MPIIQHREIQSVIDFQTGRAIYQSYYENDCLLTTTFGYINNILYVMLCILKLVLNVDTVLINMEYISNIGILA